SPLAGEQGNLLNTSWRDPGAAEAAIERVRAELGPDVVVTPRLRDGYAVERSGSWGEADEHAAGDARATPFGAGSRAFGVRTPSSKLHTSNGVAPTVDSALRLLEKPEPVDVDRDSDPRRVFWRGRAIPVLSAVGPERLSGDWWNDGYSRDYWRCESDDERELVLYRDAAGWWVQGWYD